MVLQMIGFAVLGLAVAVVATRLLPPDRLPAPTLVLLTGPAGAVLGGVVAHTVIGGGNAAATFAVAVTVALALVTLLIRPSSQHRTSQA